MSHTLRRPTHLATPTQVLKEKLREALEANRALQAQLGGQSAGGKAGAAAAPRAPLAAQNKENAA